MWKVEILPRSGKYILVIYYLDGKDSPESYNARGQIECLDQEEVDKWLRAINSMNT